MTERAYHHGNVRGAALEATLSIVEAEGAEAVGLRRVARESGVSHTAIGKELGGIAGLLTASAASVYDALVVALVTAERSHEGALDGFRAMGAAYIQFGVDHFAWMQLLVHPLVLETQDAELVAARDRTYEALLSSVRRSMAAGEVRADLPERVALHVWTAVHGFAVLRASRTVPGVLDDRDAADVLLDQLYLGLRP